MTLYRANDRLPEDETFLRISDPGEFRLFRERDALKIRGIVHNFNLTAEQRNAAINFAKFLMHDQSHQLKFSDYIEMPIVVAFDLAGKIKKEGSVNIPIIPETLFEPVTLIACCKNLALSDQQIGMSLRVNSRFPANYHSHRPAIASSFNQGGTEILNLAGISFTTVAGEIVMMGNNVLHRAVQIAQEDLDLSPRINFVS